jgi:hypothetical protein
LVPCLVLPPELEHAIGRALLERVAPRTVVLPV